MSRKKSGDYVNRSWNSLGQLKETIEADGSEKIVSFNGWQLITDKHSYGLSLGKLSRRKIEKTKANQ